jgi:actin-related protein
VLYANIVISGGTSMFPGYSTRLENDLRSIYFKEILKSKGEIKIKIDINVNLYKKRMHQIENTMYLLEQEYTQI